jgi:hypothetical protein
MDGVWKIPWTIVSRYYSISSTIMNNVMTKAHFCETLLVLLRLLPKRAPESCGATEQRSMRLQLGISKLPCLKILQELSSCGALK